MSSALYTDLYQLSMAQAYFLTGRHRQSAVFDLFFRKNPFGGGYVIAAGLDDAVRTVAGFRFGSRDLSFLKKQGFNRKFLDYLKGFRMKINVAAVREGEVVFPREPVARIEGGLLECQLAETAFINLVHFPSLIATKASRMVQAAGGRSIVDFGLRRAQGPAGLTASRAAYIGGVDGTSNVLAAKRYAIPAVGTQAHSWIQAVRDEKKAFLEFSRIYRDKTVLLIDTYNTLKSGMPHLLQVLGQLKKEGIRIRGVRIDSGDLAFLSKKVRGELNRNGYGDVKIIVSGQLDEYLIQSLIQQGAPVDGFGVGTKLITSYDQPALDMVYKLCRIGKNPEMKISDTVEKMNEPGRKKILRFSARKDPAFLLDAVVLTSERKPREVMHPYDPMAKTPVTGLLSEEILRPVVENGQVTADEISAADAKDYAFRRLSRLPPEHRRFYYPHVYRVGISRKLYDLKEKLIGQRLRKGPEKRIKKG